MKDAGSGTLGALLLALALLPQVDLDFKPPNSGLGKRKKYYKQSIGKKKNKCYFAFLLLIFASSHPHKIPLLLLTRTLWCRCKTVLIIILTHNFLLYQITRTLGCRSYHHHHHHHHPTYKIWSPGLWGAVLIIIITRPKPAYGRHGLAACSLHASGAQLESGKWWFLVTHKQTNTS